MAKPIEEIIAGAQRAKKKHHDVDVLLDQDVSERVDELEQEIAAATQELEAARADKRLGDPRPQQIQDEIDRIRDEIKRIEAEAAEAIIVLRFRKMLAEDWAEVTARTPMRIDVPVDRMYGYNVHAAARAAAPESGVQLVRGEDGEQTEVPLADEFWAEIFDLMSGRDFGRISDAIFDLNDYGPQQRLDAARKASRAGTDAKSN